MALNQQTFVGQSGAVFEWGNSDLSALCSDNIGVDVPLVRAVLAATKPAKGKKKTPGDDGDDDDKRIGTPTTNPLVGQKRAMPDDSPLPAWDDRCK
eukprot:4741950-Pyramimonas_sp.AAC.1